MITLCVLLIFLLIAMIVLLAFGTGFLLVFGDAIVAVIVIIGILYLLLFKTKKKK